MTLFDPSATAPAPSPEPRRRRRTDFGAPRMVLGLYAMAVAMLALLGLTVLPTQFVIQQPGPVVNTLGTVQTTDGEEIPMIAISGAETYDTTGQLDLLTVQIVGDRSRTPTWLELTSAWFDPSRAVVPIDVAFPEGQTVEERNEQSAIMMTDSQKEATAVALMELGYDVDPELLVASLSEDSPAEGVLDVGDTIVSADDQPVEDVYDLRDAVVAGGGDPVTLEISRDGDVSDVSITPVPGDTAQGQPEWMIGVGIAQDFTFPIDVTIQLDNIGGPSAGMMFALGIIDVLSEEDLTGGHHIAGTGTIDTTGTVGSIGGIRQKLYGAQRAGAEYFLAPASNCDEVVGHIPDGLRVFAVDTLDDSLHVLETIRDGGDLDALPTCTD